MATLKRKMAREAVKRTAKHSAHGTASKLRRDPARALTLFAAGAIAGLVAGWLLSRAGGDDGPSLPEDRPTPTPVDG